MCHSNANHACEQAGSVPSVDTLDFVMESLALGHTVMDQRQVCAPCSEVMGAAYSPSIETSLPAGFNETMSF
jgi:hypothetical protein